MSHRQSASKRSNSITTRLILFILALLLPGLSNATVVIPLTFDQMISNADLIVDGTVIEVTSQWSADHRTIFTYVRIALHEVVLGRSEPNEMTLRFEGGEVGEYRLVTAGLPSFQTGERNLFFIRGNGQAISPLVGFFQGRFRVVGRRVYDHAGIPILGIRDGKLLKPAGKLGAAVSVESPLEVPSAGEPVVGSYHYGVASSGSGAAEEERLAEPVAPEYPPRSPLPSAESSGGPALVVPAPEPKPDIEEWSISAGEAPADLLQPPSAADEAITVDEMVHEIRARLSGRQRS